MSTTRSGALPRLFHKLVIGVALAASPAAFAEPDPDGHAEEDDEGPLTEVDRALGTVFDTMVDRVLAQRGDVTEVLGILLRNMHPLDATSSVCDTALSPSTEVRRVLCQVLEHDQRIVGARSALGHLSHDGDPEVRRAAARAIKRTR